MTENEEGKVNSQYQQLDANNQQQKTKIYKN